MSPLLPALLLLACGGGPRGCGEPGPLDAQADALALAEEGERLLAEGDAAGAAERFLRAQDLDPGSPVLPAWQARAQEVGGDDAAAEATLDRAIARFPDDLDLRFNRAALRARRGDHHGAAADLAAARDCCGLLPEEAGADPDLAALVGDPRWADLVRVPGPVVMLTPEQGSVLLGEPWEAELYVAWPEGGPLSLQAMGTPPALLRRERVVEHDLGEDGGRHGIRLDLRWRCVAPGEGTLGPWLVVSGGASTLTDPAEVACVAVGRRSADAGAPGGEAVVLPSQLVGDRSPPWAGTLDGRLAVLVLPGDEVTVRGPDDTVLAPTERWERRSQERTRWEVHLYDTTPGAQVTLARDGAVLLSRTWEG